MITAAFLSLRSTDYGTTYERLNDKVGVKTVLSYLYVCPTNQRKVSESCSVSGNVNSSQFTHHISNPYIYINIIDSQAPKKKGTGFVSSELDYIRHPMHNFSSRQVKGQIALEG